ncbi:MAG: TetR/AcrR family transcriptional regulator [Candidatus Lokiarchaeota archaeon]|nr:TetR/AcrR family transcriptional regulator [Candidatus Lokiarchaeota archaeon]
MSKKSAKDKILEITEKLIIEKGYSNTNIRDITYLANVSVGTLYHHFKKGKIDLLKEIITKSTIESTEKLNTNNFFAGKDINTFSDGLKMYFLAMIENHRENRQFIAAMESEVLSNINFYDKLKNDVRSKETRQIETNLFLKPIKILLENFPQEDLNIEQNGKQIHGIVDILIHRHVYDEYTFESDEYFLQVLNKIVFSLLKD